MTLVDTSAWVEYLRATGSGTHRAVRALLEADEPFATCAAVRMEVLMGARSERHLRELTALLARGTMLPTTPGHYDEAAAMYRQCRRAGVTVRKAMDCLIGAHAVRAATAVLHHDEDFAGLARCTALAQHPASLT